MFLGVETLMILLKARHSLGITQLADALQLSKSTMHDLAATLNAMGFLDQNKTTLRYAISPEIFRFLNIVSTQFGPNSVLKPFLRAHARKLKADIVVTVLCRQKSYALCTSGLELETGDNGPAYNSASGKILVAQLDESEWLAYAPAPGCRTGSQYSNYDPQCFYAELRAARVNGVAWNRRERDANLCGVAAPLHIGDIPWSHAIGLALPFTEWVVRDREELATQVKQLADEISRLLGR